MTIGNSVTTIGGFAFSYNALTSVTIPTALRPSGLCVRWQQPHQRDHSRQRYDHWELCVRRNSLTSVTFLGDFGTFSLNMFQDNASLATICTVEGASGWPQTFAPTTGPSGSLTSTTCGSPATPSAPVATAGDAQASVTWTKPDDGGSTITGYTVTSSPDGQTCTTSDADALTCDVTGLTNGTAYTFTVTATNAVGTSAASSASNSVTPATVPGAPTIGTVTAGNTQATVTWAAPADNGGSAITSYTATAVEDGTKSCTTADGSTLTCDVTGLTNGTAYTFTVTATNAVGNSAASSASSSVTPATVPGAPTNVTAVAGDGEATVSWTAPASDGGSAITYYTATTNPSCTTSGTSCTVTGLTNGTPYTFTVTATNAVGTSAASSTSNSVTPVAPATPVPALPLFGLLDTRRPTWTLRST